MMTQSIVDHAEKEYSISIAKTQVEDVQTENESSSSQCSHKNQCRAIFLTAPASGQGKTTMTAALARMLVRQKRKVRVFKFGPDYLDPQILKQASHAPVEQLDLFMGGIDYCQRILYEASRTCDIILIEGAMGIYDGNPSSADFAVEFNIPMILLMDVRAMAQTAAAIAIGLTQYHCMIDKTPPQFVGMIANYCGSETHKRMIEDALPPKELLPMLAYIRKSSEMTLPERHLGLVQSCDQRIDELESRIDTGADLLEEQETIRALFDRLPLVEFHPPPLSSDACDTSYFNILQGYTIAIAKDEAFSFIYDANIRILQEMGAQIRYFSPVHDTQNDRCCRFDDVDGLWLPGGYPELHASKISNNSYIMEHIRSLYERGKPILAECGGYLYCLETLTDLNEQTFLMLGLLQGHGAMCGKVGCQGLQTAPLPEGNVRAHAHHHARSRNTDDPIACGIRNRYKEYPGEPIYRSKRLTGTYLHLFFPSNPLAIAKLFAREEMK